MRKFLLKNVLTFSLLFFSMVSAMAQDVTYSKETFVFGNTTLPYRKAILPGVKDKASLVVYLHGGSSKGSDNEKQLEEPAVSSICSWLINNSHKAIILVPQCPKDKTWIGTMLGTVRALIRQYIDKGLVDDSKVYLLGGSMGGTGTWNMMAAYPDLFAATMPVAGNPSGLDAVKVAQTPFYTVMGTADVILDISAVAAFLSDMKSYNATYCFDIEQGWTHEDVCKKSYTNERLSWLFSHIRGVSDGVSAANAKQRHVVSTVWYDSMGNRLSLIPQSNSLGTYIKHTVFDDGQTVNEKVIKR